MNQGQRNAVAIAREDRLGCLEVLDRARNVPLVRVRAEVAPEAGVELRDLALDAERLVDAQRFLQIFDAPVPPPTGDVTEITEPLEESGLSLPFDAVLLHQLESRRPVLRRLFPSPDPRRGLSGTQAV